MTHKELTRDQVQREVCQDGHVLNIESEQEGLQEFCISFVRGGHLGDVV